MGHLNRFLVLPHVARVAHIDLPNADHTRLKRALNPNTAAFVAPNHPEFFTDWMIDKELSRRYAPLMSSWAAQDIVNASPLAQRFWLANGLIANTPRGGGKAYSLRAARAGRGVLLHPEGGVNWQAERIAPIHPGAIDMAVALAQLLQQDHDPRPVYVVPLAWRLAFTADVSAPLLAEMQYIERAAGLVESPSRHVGERLSHVLAALLVTRAYELRLRRPDISLAQPGPDYFAAQHATMQEIQSRLATSFGTLGDDPVHVIRTVERGIRRRGSLNPDRTAQDQALLREFRRLVRIDATLYGRDTITQEQVAEILKATRMTLLTQGFRNTVHALIPRAVASRIAHVRVAEPIDISWSVTAGVAPAALHQALARCLQHTTDTLGRALEPAIGRFRIHNPMAVDNERYWINKGA